jgi:hypothetical protein
MVDGVSGSVINIDLHASNDAAVMLMTVKCSTFY